MLKNIIKFLKKIKCSCLNVCKIQINDNHIEFDIKLKNDQGILQTIPIYKISYI